MGRLERRYGPTKLVNASCFLGREPQKSDPLSGCGSPRPEIGGPGLIVLGGRIGKGTVGHIVSGHIGDELIQVAATDAIGALA